MERSDKAWVGALRRRLEGEAGRWGRRDPARHPEAAHKAALRTHLVDVLDRFDDAGDHWMLAVAACWGRSLDAADAWIDAVGPVHAAAALDAMGSTPVQDRLHQSTDVVKGIATHGPFLPERLAGEALRALEAVGASRHVRRGVGAAFRTLHASEATPTTVQGVLAAVREATLAMEVPEWAAAMQARGAVRVLDRRLASALALLESQSAWLVDCGDPMLHPGMRAVLAGLRAKASQRYHLARAAAAGDHADAEDRRMLVDAARRIERGVDTADVHARIAEMAARCSPPSRVPEALRAIGWPADPAAQLTWSPVAVIDRGAQGRLLTLMESRFHQAGARNTQRWRQRCEEVEAAARAVLRGPK